MKKPKENKHQHLLLLLAVLLLLLTLTAWVGWKVYENREARYRHQVEMDLKNTSDLTVRNLSDWRDRLVTVAGAMTDDTLFARAATTWLRQADSTAQADLEARMRVLVERGRLTKIILVDPQGQVRLATSDLVARELPAREMQAFQQALQSAQAVLVEPSVQDHFAYPSMSVIAPLYDGMQSLGALWMVVDLRDALFPLLDAVRGGRATAEAVLLMPQGNEILHINPLRHGTAAQGVGHFASLAQQEMVEVQAVRGIRGVVYGLDYQRQAVLSASSVVPDSPWLLVYKMEVDEAFAQDRRKEGLYFGLLIGGSFLAVMAFIIYWMWLTWRREQALTLELKIHMKWLERAQQTASIGFFSIDYVKKKINLSKIAAKIFDTQGLLELNFEEIWTYISPKEFKASIKPQIKALQLNDPKKIELSLPGADGHPRTLECWCELDDASPRSGPPKIIGTVQDITLRKQTERELEQLAHKDSLTGLANRRALDELLDREWRRAVRDALPIAALIMDIDFFKDYNDFYGHLAGDSCLQRVAQVLQRNVQRSKDMVFRYGGEEFVVLLPATRLPEARQLAEKLCLALQDERIENQASPLGGVVTMSVGVACLQPLHDDTGNGHRLLENADIALYTAKHAGKNQAAVRADEAGAD